MFFREVLQLFRQWNREITTSREKPFRSSGIPLKTLTMLRYKSDKQGGAVTYPNFYERRKLFKCSAILQCISRQTSCLPFFEQKDDLRWFCSIKVIIYTLQLNERAVLIWRRWCINVMGISSYSKLTHSPTTKRNFRYKMTFYS